MLRRLPAFALALAIVALGLGAGPASADPPSNDPELGSQWGLTDIKAPEAWGKGKGAGIKVAVVSSGIAPHPDLAGKVDGGFGGNVGDPTADPTGRGTHLAGIVGARTNNGEGIAAVAPDARVLPFKAFEDGASVNAADFVEALRQAQKAGSQVALVDIPDNFPSSARDLLRQAFISLGSAGMSVVVGAGAVQLDDLPVLAVAATAPGGGRASGTVTGKGVGAPGQDVLSTNVKPSLLPGGAPTYDYSTASGTSQAAAHVAGATAILRGLGATSAQAADLLRKTARKGDPALGAGAIDVKAAADAYQVPPPTTAPTTPTTTKATSTPGVKAPTGTAAFPKNPGAAAGPTDPALAGEPGDPGEPGVGDSPVVPPGADELADSGGGESGGPSSPVSGGQDRPIGALAVGFGLLFGVGSGLSVTFRRLAQAATTA